MNILSQSFPFDDRKQNRLLKPFIFCLMMIGIIFVQWQGVVAQDLVPLYEEGFDRDMAEGWELSEGWVVDGEQLNGSGAAMGVYNKEEWGEGLHVLEFEIGALSREGVFHLGVHHNQIGRYLIGFEQVAEDGLIVYFEKQYWDGGSIRLATWDSQKDNLTAQAPVYDPKCPYQVTIEFGDGHLALFISSVCEYLFFPDPVLMAFDLQPLQPGGISFESLDKTDYVMIDNLVLYGPQRQPEKDVIQFGDCPEGELLYAENFDREEISGWEWEDGWSLEEGFLRGEGHFFADYTLESWKDLTLIVRFFPTKGREGIHINTRSSDTGRYFVTINPEGVYLLKQLGWGRNQEFFNLAFQNSSFEWEAWHTLEFTVRGEQISVSLDGEEQVSARDEAPLPEGRISLETLDDSAVLVDAVWVCGPPREGPIIPPAQEGLPDLSIQDVMIEPFDSVNGIQILWVFIVNYGNISSDNTNLLVENQEGTAISYDQRIEAIEPGELYRTGVKLAIPEEMLDQNDRLEVTIDSDNGIREENEDNNQFITDFIEFPAAEDEGGLDWRNLLWIGGVIVGIPVLFMLGRAIYLKIEEGRGGGKGEEPHKTADEEPGSQAKPDKREEPTGPEEPDYGRDEAEMEVDETPAADVDKEEEPRFLQAEVFDNSHPDAPKKLSQAFLADREQLLNVWIGKLKTGAIVAPEPIDFTLLPDLPSWELEVYFWEPYHAPEVQLGHLTLYKNPQPGEPDPLCQFTFIPRPDRAQFQGRLAVVYENNVLQMLFLEGKVVSDLDQATGEDKIQLKWAEIKGLANPDLLQKFDLVFYNESDRDLGAGLTFFGGKAGLKRASGLDQGISDLTLSLKQLASPQPTSPDVQRFNLVVLANQGRSLYQTIQEQLGAMGHTPIDLQHVTRLQLVSAIRDVFPLEMVYVYPAPSPDAELCPNAEQAILEGKCDHCENLDPGVSADVICPLGFLGMRCVVERHIIQPLAQSEAVRVGSDYQLLVGLTAGGKNLSPFKSSLAATSSEVQPNSKQKLTAALRDLFPQGFEFAENWNDWKEKVKNKPSTLVLVPHTKREANIPSLEIGNSTLWNTGINKTILGESEGSQPLVLLLGCETALPEVPYQGFAAYFSAAGAAITVITLSPIHESRAVPIAEILMRQCYQSAQEHRTFSEALMLTRRTAMAKGYPEVLTLVADGDADWVLVEG